MLNAHRLKDAFTNALTQSWDIEAIWPDCKDGYEHGVSHPSYGQCLVGTLVTWAAHGGQNGSFDIIPGILEGENLPDDGMWHFQLMEKTGETRIPIDVTWDQAENGIFTPSMSCPDLQKQIINGSFPEDKSLVPRLSVILQNLEVHDYSVGIPAKDIVEQAYIGFDL